MFIRNLKIEKDQSNFCVTKTMGSTSEQCASCEFSWLVCLLSFRFLSRFFLLLVRKFVVVSLAGLVLKTFNFFLFCFLDVCQKYRHLSTYIDNKMEWFVLISSSSACFIIELLLNKNNNVFFRTLFFQNSIMFGIFYLDLSDVV